MKNNQLIGMLLAILFITTGVAGWLCIKYTSTVRARRQIAPELAFIHNEEGVINALAADAVEYSKKNPGISPILKAFNLLPPGGTAPAPAGTKPATR
jgi:hypothetical protein